MPNASHSTHLIFALTPAQVFSLPLKMDFFSSIIIGPCTEPTTEAHDDDIELFVDSEANSLRSTGYCIIVWKRFSFIIYQLTSVNLKLPDFIPWLDPDLTLTQSFLFRSFPLLYWMQISCSLSTCSVFDVICVSTAVFIMDLKMYLVPFWHSYQCKTQNGNLNLLLWRRCDRLLCTIAII